MSAPEPDQIDLYRLRELIRTAGTLREPNWRSMLTPAGEAAQNELRVLWTRFITMIETAERGMKEEEK
jgi:hypothetical protein